MYNLFADKLLGLNFVPQSVSYESGVNVLGSCFDTFESLQVIDMHTQYLSSLLTTAPQWGLPIDSTTSQFGNAGELNIFFSLWIWELTYPLLSRVDLVYGCSRF